MLKSRRFKATILAALLITPISISHAQVDTSSCVIEGLKKDMEYKDAREVIIAAGFGPDQRDYSSHMCVYPRMGVVAEYTCEEYPEAEMCAPTGNAPCNMTFIDGNGNRLLVGTISELPFVSGWRYDCRGWESEALSWSSPK